MYNTPFSGLPFYKLSTTFCVHTNLSYSKIQSLVQNLPYATGVGGRKKKLALVQKSLFSLIKMYFHSSYLLLLKTHTLLSMYTEIFPILSLKIILLKYS